tara:strand:+ start:123 stop:401 length:279 start_codon:yes stop_codon:yes gene_type:complete
MSQLLLILLVCVGTYFLIRKMSNNGRKIKVKPIRTSKATIGDFMTMDDNYNTVKIDKKRELNRILDNIVKRERKTITKKEREFLDEYSDNLN